MASYYDILGETIVREATGYQLHNAPQMLGAEDVVSAAKQLVEKSVQAYNDKPAIVPSGISEEQKSFFTKHYGGVPGWGWILISGFGLMLLNSWINSKLSQSRRN